MRKLEFLTTGLLVAAALAGPAAIAQAQAQAQKPNILIIMGDDIGVPQISAYTQGLMGYRTPNIDRIAREGGVFSTNAGNHRSLAWWSVFMVCSREGPWASRNMSSAIRPLMVA